MRPDSMNVRKGLTRFFVYGALLALVHSPLPAGAQTFSSGSTGADGAFNPTCTPTPCTVTRALPPNGIFNFTTVNIPAGVTVTFQRNTTNTPAVLLASGDVLVNGAITVDGTAGASGIAGTLPLGLGGSGGPGGFVGGNGGRGAAFGGTAARVGGGGLGPGGGKGGNPTVNNFGGGGGFGTPGEGQSPRLTGGVTYGNATLTPLIGGSGGGGGAAGSTLNGGGGGGGGGALLVASSGTITANGLITANGGKGGPWTGSPSDGLSGGGGSGGGIRLIASAISGSGTIRAVGGAPPPGGTNAEFFQRGGNGRIRLETFTYTFTGSVSPTPSIATPGDVFLAGAPSLVITSVGGVATPAAPSGGFGSPDITFPAATTNPITISIAATNVPLDATIQVTVTPFVGDPTTLTAPPLSGTVASSSTSASATLPTDQPTVISAFATFIPQATAGGGPLLIGGEPVQAIRVAATYGGGSTVTYITASGREVPMR